MIGYLEGHIIHCESDAILLLAGQVGYEVLVSPFTMDRVLAESKTADDKVCLYIYYHVTERQPKPVLIGFASLADKAFFQLFISVAAIGPMKAVKALVSMEKQGGLWGHRQIWSLIRQPLWGRTNRIWCFW